MEVIPIRCELLEHYPNTLEVVRKDLNLDKRMIEESIDILENWLKKQTHFVKNDFNRDFLERSLIVSKGSIERAKNGLDKLCTFKTIMPELFSVYNVESELQSLKSYINCGFLPKLTVEHQRVFMLRFNTDSFDSEEVFKCFKFLTVIAEFSRKHEYCSGFHLVMDLRNVNVLSVVSKMNPLEFRKIMTLLIEGYCMRVKGIHMLSESKLIDSFIALFKQVLSSKIASRIHAHKTLDSFYKAIKPIDILPKEYGGKEMPLEKLCEEWFKILSTEEHIEYMKEMNKAVTIESCRKLNNFNERYIGLPGSFRALSVD